MELALELQPHNSSWKNKRGKLRGNHPVAVIGGGEREFVVRKLHDWSLCSTDWWHDKIEDFAEAAAAVVVEAAALTASIGGVSTEEQRLKVFEKFRMEEAEIISDE